MPAGSLCKSANVFTNICLILFHFRIAINVTYYGHEKYMDEDCTGCYTKSTDCHMYVHCTDHENIKAIDFLILNEIVQYLIKYSQFACVKYMCNNIL